MLLKKLITRQSLLFAAGASIAFATPARADIQLGILGGLGSTKDICLSGSSVYVEASSDDCADPGGNLLPTELRIGGGTQYVRFDAATGVSTFNAPANFNANVQMSGLQAFSGTTAFNSTVSFVGPSVTFDSPADFNDPITTAGISNQGNIATSSITTGTATFSTSLTVGAGATINLGGNRVQGVAAGINPLDAVNVAQLNAATSGISADLTALETVTATHTTQIANIEAVNTTQSNQIAAVEAVNTAQSSQITAIEAVNTTQSNQITAVQAVNTTQSNQITAIQAVNTTQSGQISALEAASLSMAESIDTLFDLRSSDRRDMKQGVASAIAIAPAPMPSAPGKVSYAVNGATFRGEYAVGGSMMYRLPGDTPVAFNVGFSYAGNKNNGVRVGVAGEF